MTLSRSRLVSAMLLALPGLAVLASAGPAGRPADRPMGGAADGPGDGTDHQTATIRISLDSGGVVVTPEQATVRQGEAIEWSSDLPFGLDVERNDELFGRRLPPQALRGRENAAVRAAVSAGAPVGSYKYAVAVWDGENVWVMDPEIVVRPSGR